MQIPEVIRACGCVAIFWLAAGCGGSSVVTTPSAPSPPRCTVSVSTNNSTVPAAGGVGTLRIATERECSWTASADVGWITLTGPRDGFGTADISFTVAPNPNVANRRGTIVVNGQRAELTQAPAPPPPVPCAVSLTPAAQTVGAGGGTVSIVITAAASCSWNATSDAAWLTVVGSNAGSGNGTIRFQAAANSGSSRAGVVRVNDRTATVTQAGR
jgi:hypothetical protein